MSLLSAASSGDAEPLLEVKGANIDSGMISPNGRWIAYRSDESGRNEVYVTSFPDAERKWQVSVEGGSMPRWPNSGELFYESFGGHIIAVQTRPGTRQFEWTGTRRLFANPLVIRPQRPQPCASAARAPVAHAWSTSGLQARDKRTGFVSLATSRFSRANFERRKPR